jgi:ParB/RepB/Spo0J family partition protein
MLDVHEKNIEVVNLPISRVKPNTFNPNTQSEEVFNALVENIREIGMVEPILVVPDPQSDGDYIVISGEHRLEACRVLGYETVPAIIRQDYLEELRGINLLHLHLFNKTVYQKLLQFIVHQHPEMRLSAIREHQITTL